MVWGTLRIFYFLILKYDHDLKVYEELKTSCINNFICEPTIVRQL